MLKDDSTVIGSPGSYSWKGNIFMANVSNDYLRRDKAIYHSPVENNEKSLVFSDSYLGKLINKYL